MKHHYFRYVSVYQPNYSVVIRTWTTNSPFLLFHTPVFACMISDMTVVHKAIVCQFSLSYNVTEGWKQTEHSSVLQKP